MANLETAAGRNGNSFAASPLMENGMVEGQASRGSLSGNVTLIYESAIIMMIIMILKK